MERDVEGERKKVRIEEDTQGQAIVPQGEETLLSALVTERQDTYRAAGIYKKHKNIPEELIPEYWVERVFKKQLPGWNVQFGSIYFGGFDFKIVSPSGKEFSVEVKTKPEDAYWYVAKFFGQEAIDRSPAVPRSKYSQILNADFVIMCRTSRFNTPTRVTSIELDSSTMVDGIYKKGDFTKQNLVKINEGTENEYAWLEFEKTPPTFRGSHSLFELTSYLKANFQ